jgi:hypothetical protein
MQTTPSPIKPLKYRIIIVNTKHPPNVLINIKRMIDKINDVNSEINDIFQVDFKSLII